MKRYVLDTYAVLTYLNGESGAEQVAELLKKGLTGHAQLWLSMINWGEGYYITLRDGHEKAAEIYRSTLLKYPVTIAEVDEELTIQAARYKAFNKMSFADAFAAGLAKLKNAELVTGDKEFLSLAKDIKILWINET